MIFELSERGASGSSVAKELNAKGIERRNGKPLPANMSETVTPLRV